ncbi:CoA-binding protein [Allomuricauda sp. F6463D]|uniref:CoA-binding protein n=1 Tax=Allomuricauda sp. F6463D TaxID=2926409 RepID=UPI001FF31D6C|nr:CoA-binding protein [Muricauda sp. F6463D]MCK0162183.1 CoA-binding protein [Muricauda sp. F6463D]
MKKTLVVGASTNPGRYSNKAIRKLVANNIETTAFGIRGGTVSDVQIKDNLSNFQNIDTVTLYLNPNHQKEYYQQIVDLKPRRVIFNPGTENPEFYKILDLAGIEVDVACTLVLLSTGQY